MKDTHSESLITLSIVIPCYNEEKTLRYCVESVLGIRDSSLTLEIIIVDDCSRDRSLEIANQLEETYPEVEVIHHRQNMGKGAALRTGFKHARGRFVGVQDADLEYDPKDFKRILEPLLNDQADVVLGSRFLSTGAHRVLYFWHYIGNRFLTFLSNMFTDLNLTDMETCYKVFRRDILQSIDIEENRFGFEPEIVAKIAHLRVRIYEVGISYYARTYAEGKKIGAKDGFRALYCILRYNGHRAPVAMQFMIYLFVGGVAALVNLGLFLALFGAGFGILASCLTAYFSAAVVNYFLCILLLFRHRAQWSLAGEIVAFLIVILSVAALDAWLTRSLINFHLGLVLSKSIASLIGLMANFLGRRLVVFSEAASGEWKNQVDI